MAQENIAFAEAANTAAWMQEDFWIREAAIRRADDEHDAMITRKKIARLEEENARLELQISQFEQETTKLVQKLADLEQELAPLKSNNT